MADSILIVEDDAVIRKLLEKLLTISGYSVRSVGRGDAVRPALDAAIPSLLLLDWSLPGKAGIDVLRELRADPHPRLRELPIIMLTAHDQVDDKIAGMDAGVDDYVSKPYDDRELVARIRAAIRRRQEALEASPLTGLPGNHAIHEELERRVEAAAPLAVAYIDIDNFKVYNDLYGFERGDEAIKRVAEIIEDVVPDFIGHVGGDDFIFLSTPARIGDEADEVLRRFRGATPTLYEAEDVARGSIRGEDRQGVARDFPLMTLSIVAVTNERFALTHPAEIAKVAAEMKHYAKSQGGDGFYRDRRGAVSKIVRKSEVQNPESEETPNSQVNE